MAQLGNLIVTGSSRFLNKVYFSDEGVFSGDLNLASGNLILAGKTAIRGGVDTWLRINDTNAFSNGIYCGSNTLRTDGEFQVGSTGNYFKANSLAITCGKALNANAGLNVSGVTTLNNGVVVKNVGVELYHTTPFIDFHYNNSTADYTSRIIESSNGQININGVNFSNSTISATSVTSTNHTATNSTINTLTVSSRLAADAANAVFNNVYVKDELRSTTWAIDNITNLGSTFYVAPCIIFTNPSVYINSKSGTTVTLTITDNAIISSTIGGQTWTSGSKVKLMGRINTSILGVVNGTMARQLNTTTTKTAYITLNFVTADDCAGIVQGQTYSGTNVGDLKLMMYEVNLSVNGGATKNRPVGIRMSSYNEDKKSSIDIYNGTVDDGKPVARMGALDGLPAVNGTNPTGYGFYAAGNAYFNGTLVTSSGTIGGFTISNNAIQNGNMGATNSVIMCIGSNSSANIGGSGSINGWCFTASNTFGVTKAGALYSTSGKIGKYTITDKWLITGSGSSCTGIGGNQAFWAGSESSDNAPFRVSYGGSIYSVSGTIGSFTLDSTYLQSSDKTVGLSATASDWAFWAGGSSSSTAKFRVNHAGQLWATSATISGNVTATSGTIGGCSIENGTLSITNANSNYAVFEGNGKTNGYFHIATIKITGSYIDRAMVIGAQSRGYGYSEINLQFINVNNADPGLNFFNQTGRGDWYIKKTATSTWNIYYKKSEVWGYTRIIKYIDSPNVTLTWGSGNADLPASSTRATQLAGSSAWCYNNDSTYINGGNIYTGTVTANAIAANAITADKIKSGEVTSDKIAAGAITADKITTDNIASADDNNWINLRKGTFSYNKGVLSWDGSIMKIGGWNVTSDSLYVNNKTGMSANTSNYAFWAGESNGKNGVAGTDAKFRVGHTGSLYAEDATIGGIIRAKQTYSIYSNVFSTYQDVISWTGESLEIGLVGDGVNSGANGVQINFIGNQIDLSADLVTCHNSLSSSTLSTGTINATSIYTSNGEENKGSSMGLNLYTHGTLSVEGKAGLHSDAYVVGNFTFRDYAEQEKKEENNLYDVALRRPIASASSSQNRIAWIKSADVSGKKVIGVYGKFGSDVYTQYNFTSPSSDIRLKKNIYGTNVKALPIVMQMKMHKFDWRDDNSHQPLGCIADELEKLDPMLTFGGGYEKDGSMNVKCINTLLLTEYNSKAIQELYTLVQKQESKIKYLENQLKDKKR